MTKTKPSKVATENFIWRVVSESEERISKRFDEVEVKSEERYDKMMEHLVDIAGKFKKFDEAQTILSGRVYNHEDRIEKLEGLSFKSS
jgi:hypothetical protein